MKLGIVGIVAALALSGCLCNPLLEVRYCRQEQAHCIPHELPVHVWNATDAQTFPGVQEWLDKLEIGTHGHLDYTHDLEDAFWDYWGLDNSELDQEVFIEYQGGIYRLRVYSCD